MNAVMWKPSSSKRWSSITSGDSRGWEMNLSCLLPAGGMPASARCRGVNPPPQKLAMNVFPLILWRLVVISPCSWVPRACSRDADPSRLFAHPAVSICSLKKKKKRKKEANKKRAWDVHLHCPGFLCFPQTWYLCSETEWRFVSQNVTVDN